MKKKVFKPLQLNKKYITNLENHIKGGNTPTHVTVCGTGTSAANCTNRPSDKPSDCCLVTNSPCGGGGGNEVTAPSVEWCPSINECVGPADPIDPIGPLPTTIFPIC